MMAEGIEMPVIDQQAVGNRIKRLRKENHLRVSDISNILGFTGPQAVYKWQRGECLPDYANMIVLSRILGTTIEQILLGDGKEKDTRGEGSAA